MKLYARHLLAMGFLLSTFVGFSQDDDTDSIDDSQIEESNIRNLTPSKLIGLGQADLKWFNNFFTTTNFIDLDGNDFEIPRQTFLTSTLEVFFGVSELRRVNLGFILEGRSNSIGGQGFFDVLGFNGENGVSRSGLTSIAPSIKISPFPGATNLSLQSSLFIPLVDRETDENVFLDQDGFTWQNRFFYDLVLPGGDFQLFFELNAEYHFGDTAVNQNETNGSFSTIEGSFANDSFSLFPGVFFSYFPSSKFTVSILTQHFVRYDLGDSIEQNFTASGGGIKYQLTKELNIEALYTNFWRANNNNTGSTFNLGLRLVL